MSKYLFKNIGIIGVGLIGGSIGLDVKKKKLAKKVFGYGRTRKNLEVAIDRGIIDEMVFNLKELCDQCDLIILAVPVLKIENLIVDIAEYVHEGQIIIDAGSTKEGILKTASDQLPKNVSFIGTHPMSGTENSGAISAVSGLYQDKVCVITPREKTPLKDINLIKKFWETLGSRVVKMKAHEHDVSVASISHLPHLAAFSLIHTISHHVPLKDIKNLKGGGLMDTTRVAGSPYEMWRDISLANKKAIIQTLKHYEGTLNQLITWIENDEAKNIAEFFKENSEIRRKLN